MVDRNGVITTYAIVSNRMKDHRVGRPYPIIDLGHKSSTHSCVTQNLGASGNTAVTDYLCHKCKHQHANSNFLLKN
uniref:Serine/arginine-rich SC35-like splicing factor SCL28 isoform X2 n=1 Tax=Rhizophora mucronata TaxID=61149 RepID=A0A2P2KPC2_RHIMU